MIAVRFVCISIYIYIYINKTIKTNINKTLYESNVRYSAKNILFTIRPYYAMHMNNLRRIFLNKTW